jgi:RNA polymerase sigma factor (sigma-70 family)
MAVCPREIAQLWESSSAALTLLARTRCSAPDDCVQEAFIRLSQQPELPREPIAWLSRVVRNAAISQWRSESRRARREERAAHLRPSWFVAPSNSLDPNDPIALTEALQGLHVDDRELVVAYIWAGLTFRQIAESFGWSSATVYRRYQAALQALRVRLESASVHRKRSDSQSIPVPSHSEWS